MWVRYRLCESMNLLMICGVELLTGYGLRVDDADSTKRLC